ncbi:MAG TPA: SurA N-terminal domain-containing protein [Methylophilaceae bacterium]|nr:SurA N-terminal domain-containing protein [Methylophilaceae bacterium]
MESFREHSKGWLAKLILAFITVPFALWGIDSYLQGAGSNVAVAKVNGQNITVQEYDNALQTLRSQLQQEGKTDPALLDDPAVKQSVLNRLIVSRLLTGEVRSANLVISDEQLGKTILEMPEFSQNGKFSQEVYDSVLKQNNLTPTQFESRMRGELLTKKLRDGVTATAFAPHAVSDNLIQIDRQQREVSIAAIKAADFLGQAKVDAAQVQAFYDKNKDKFRVPEQVKIEFVIFSSNNLITSTPVAEDEVKKFYQENASKFQGDEQRRASHILVAFDKKDDTAKKAAHEKAESVLAEVNKNPAKFDELARKYSQDPGSAANGGDLGLFGRGMMVKPFEDAVFSMKPGAVSGLVESDFGYHIIKLTEIKGQAPTYDDVKAQIRAELLNQKALAKFAEQAEGFNNMVYEQSDSLQPVVKAFNVPLQTSQWMSREDAMKFFKSDKLVKAIFSDEVLKDKRNTEAVEAAPNTLVAARVVDYKPAAPRSFAEVAPAIEEHLKREQAFAMAVKKGEADLAQLRAGREVAGLEWIPPVVIARDNTQGLSEGVVQQAFKIDADKLPAYGSLQNQGADYTLIRVSRVESSAPQDEAEKTTLRSGIQTALAAEYLAAYIGSLRYKANITTNQQLLGAGAQQ